MGRQPEGQRLLVAGLSPGRHEAGGAGRRGVCDAVGGRLSRRRLRHAPPARPRRGGGGRVRLPVSCPPCAVPDRSAYSSLLMRPPAPPARLLCCGTSRPMGRLAGQPKALLPCGGGPILDHWLWLFRHRCRGAVDEVLVVTNEVFYPALSRWARERGIDQSRVLSNGTTDNSTRKGACADLAFILEQRADVIQDRRVLVVASDLLFTADGLDLDAFLFNTAAHAPAACMWYAVTDADVSKRGILEVDAETMKVTGFLEKPAPSDTASRRACPPLYSFHPRVVGLLSAFLDTHRTCGAAPAQVLAEVDAPGKFLAWLVGRGDVHMVAHPVTGRFDIGNLAQYQEALDYFAAQQQRALASGRLPEQVCCSCPARIGLAGNPSDQFGGKVLAITCPNFEASVCIRAAAPAEGNSLVILPHPVLDGGVHPGGFEQLVHEVWASSVRWSCTLGWGGKGGESG